ncbi:hypothetical protein DMP17_05890 [Pseudonocardia sp. TMWB2A]
MNMLNSLTDMAAKMGLDPEMVKGLQTKFQEKLAASGDQAQALKDTVAEYGISMEQLQGAMAKLNEEGGLLDKVGIGGQDGLMSKLDKDGDGNPLNDITDSVKGFFGKK